MCRYLRYLIFPHLGGHDGIERNHEDHHSQASQGAGAEDPPQEVHAEHDAWVGGGLVRSDGPTAITTSYKGKKKNKTLKDFKR